jgi:hypothetical protein
MMIDFNFEDRAPSITQIRARVRAAIGLGHDFIQITWGENCITLEYSDYFEAWTGWGCIRRVSGDDLARELNKGFARVPYDFMRA